MKSITKQFYKILSGVFLFILIHATVFAVGYLEDNFANGNNWKLGLRYNMELGVWTTPVATGGGRVSNWTVTGSENTMNAWIENEFGYTTSFFGIYSLFTNQTFSASKNHPLGIEITRNRLRNNNGVAAWLAGVFDMGFVQNNSAVVSGTDGAKFPYSAIISELDWQDKNTKTWYNWREKSFTNSKLSLIGVSNLAGLSQDITPLMEWDYSSSTNTNPLRYRFVLDGEYVYWYVNPSPNNVNTSYSNTFFLVDKIPVPSSFTNNISFLNGFAMMNDNADIAGWWTPPPTVAIANLSNFTIRSIASSITSEIAPAVIKAGGTADLNLVVKPDFSAVGFDPTNYAGIEEIYVDLPAGSAYTNWADYTNSLGVFWVDGASTVKTFGREAGDKNPASGSVAVSIQNGGTRLKVRFNATSATVNDIFHPDNLGAYTDPAIRLVLSNFTTTASADSTGVSFTVYVGNEKYSDTDWPKYATTGKMESYAGNAYDMTAFASRDDNTLTLKTVNDPVGIASIRPGQVYEGDVATFYYDISMGAATNNNADVTRVEIKVPTGFSINTGSFGSDRISSNYISLTNKSGADYIVADYNAAGTKLVAGSGIDTITFKNTTTPSLTGTNVTSFEWPSYSYSSVSGTGVATNDTNAVYPSRLVDVRKKPPSGEAYVNPVLLKNTSLSNTIDYIVKNKGLSGNNIEKLLLELDSLITNVSDISSGYPANISTFSSNAHIYIKVDYQAAGDTLTNGFNDTISFMAWAAVEPITNKLITVSIPSYADNGNGEGFLPLSQAVYGWDLTYYTPPASVVASIDSPVEEGGDIPTNYLHQLYTDLTGTTNVIFTVKNWGEKYNDIYEVELDVPVEITTISGVNSANGIARITNFGVTNAVVVSYTNSGLLTAGDNPSLGEEDTITIFVQDSVTAPKDITFKVYAKNTTNFAEGGNRNPDNLTLNYIYPPAMAKGYVDVPGGFIDAATNQYTLNYIITNTGRLGNKINKVWIKMPPQFTNSSFVSNTYGGTADDSGTNIVIDYSGIGGLAGGSADTVTLTVYDNVLSGEYYVPITLDVSNDRWLTNNMSTPAGQTQDVHITPPPTLYAYGTTPTVLVNATAGTHTNTVRVIVTNRGWGSNNLDKVRIEVPTALIGKVLSVSNVLTGLSNTVAGPLKLSNSGQYIWMEYDTAGTNLSAGVEDTNILSILVDTSTASDSQWLVNAANNSTNASGDHLLTNTGTMIAGMTNQVVLADEAYGHIYSPDPPQLATPTTFNNISYYVKNGDSTTGFGIKKIRIALTNQVFNDVNNVTTLGGYYTTNYFTNGNQYAEVWYSGNGLGPTSSDTIGFTAFDTNASDEIFVKIPFEVDYGDGTGWHSETGVTPTYTNGVDFVRPAVSGLSYVTPNEVPQDYPSETYSFYLKNNGVTGSDIMRMEIRAPEFITDITSVTSYRTLSNVIMTNTNGISNIVIMYYTNALLADASGTDTVTLLGYDSITGTTNGTWQVYVNNSFDTNGQQAAIVPVGTSLGLSIINPPVDARIRISATNSATTTNLNEIYSTESTNYLKFEVFNQSGGGDFLTHLRIKIPGINTVLDTNGIKVTNLIKSNATWSLSNDYIVIDYQSGNYIGAGYKDEILITVKDLVSHSETSVTWSADAAFDTTYNKYRAATLFSGASLNIAYIMPQAKASVTLNPSEVYVNQASFTLSYSISNTGSVGNDIDLAIITLPNVLRTGFDLSKLSNTIAVSTNYNSGTGELTLGYTNLTPGTVDKLYLKLSNTESVSEYVSVSARVRNYVNTNAAAGVQSLYMASVPTYYVTPNTVDTTTSSNAFQIFVNNDSTGSRTIKRVILDFPSEFTNIVSVSSAFFTNGATNIVGTVSSITLYYEAGNELGQLTNKDVVNIVLQDGVAIGDFTNSVMAYADNGTGFVPMNETSGRSKELVFAMPRAQASTLITPEFVYLGTLTNGFTLTITNEGSGSSRLSYTKVELPSGLSDAHNITSSWGGIASYDATSNVIVLDYTTNLLDAGQKDVLTFKAINGYGSSTNVNIAVKVANLTNKVIYTNAQGPLGPELVMNVSYPPIAVEAYFPQDYRLYTIETNATLSYRLFNRSYGKILTKAVINFGTNLGNVFSNVTVQSSIASTTVQYLTNSNAFVLTYDITDPDAVGYTGYDDVKLTFGYATTNLFGINLDTEAWVSNDTLTEGTNIMATGVLGYQSYIMMTNSSWGIAKGTVSPTIKAVNIKVYYPGTTTVATNISGESVGTSTSAGNGAFTLTRLPAGPYDVCFSGTGYRNYILPIVVSANAITNLGSVNMRNGLLTSDPNAGMQVVTDYNETNTYMQFPSGAIDDEFSLDISKTDFTQPQKDSLDSQGDIIDIPPNKNNLYGYQFVLRDADDHVLEGAILKLDATLHIAYDMSEINTNGWDWKEADLAIYYWDENGSTPRWVRVGGTVDTTESAVVAKVSYVHPYYAVMGKVRNGNGVIQNVILRPKVFTPGGRDGYFKTVRLSFDFDKAYDSYEVDIYDLRGNLLRSFNKTGGYSQGEVAWDGLDNNGMPVKSGVYVYRVKVSGAAYTGTVIIAR